MDSIINLKDLSVWLRSFKRPKFLLFQTIERLQKQSSKLQDNEIEIQQLRETLGDYNVQVGGRQS